MSENDIQTYENLLENLNIFSIVKKNDSIFNEQVIVNFWEKICCWLLKKK